VFLIMALPLAFKVGMPFLGALLSCSQLPQLGEKSRGSSKARKKTGKSGVPNGYVHAWKLRDFAYKNENSTCLIGLISIMPRKQRMTIRSCQD
jgi:hypothetical protein